MDYRKGSIGRIFAVRIDHGEDVLGELSGLAVKEEIRSAFFIMLGAMGSADLVTGPKDKVVPPTIVWSKFDDAREILGAGDIFWENGAPKIHLHGPPGAARELLWVASGKRHRHSWCLRYLLLRWILLREGYLMKK